MILVDDKKKLYITKSPAATHWFARFQKGLKKRTRVVCGDCNKRGRTAKGVSDETKRLKRLLTCASCQKEFARQGHISDEQESKHFTRKSKGACAYCIADGFTARCWQAY